METPGFTSAAAEADEALDPYYAGVIIGASAQGPEGGAMARTPEASRRERIEEFLRRLAATPPAAVHDEAMRQVADILNAVEDEMTSIPYDPAFPLNDGRMYPPQPDSRRAIPDRTDVIRYRSKRHSTLIGDNGAIRIVDHASGDVVFDKPGADGRTI
jgi:hypothetical protein